MQWHFSCRFLGPNPPLYLQFYTCVTRAYVHVFCSETNVTAVIRTQHPTQALKKPNVELHVAEVATRIAAGFRGYLCSILDYLVNINYLFSKWPHWVYFRLSSYLSCKIRDKNNRSNVLQTDLQARVNKWYMGCYKDDKKDDRMLKGSWQELQNNSPDVCHKLCLKTGFLYFGLTWMWVWMRLGMDKGLMACNCIYHLTA